MDEHRQDTGPRSDAQQAFEPGADALDVLISRVIDGEATPEDWAWLKRLASVDAGVWRAVAEAQMVHASLARSVDHATARAAMVDAPVDEGTRFAMRRRVRLFSSWGGWALAAALLLAIGLGPRLPMFAPTGGNADGTVLAGAPGSGLFSPATPDEALQKYIELGAKSGTVLQHVPQHTVLRVSELPGGRGYEVVYLRQLIERQVLREFYGVGQTDSGVVVPTSPMPVERVLRVNVRPASSGL